MPRSIASLNYFFALIVVGSALAIRWITPPIKLLFVHPGTPIYYNINFVAIGLVICLVSAAWWITKSILPIPTTAMTKLMLMVGSVAIAFGNGAIALALIVSLVGIAVDRQYGLAVGFIFAAAFMLALPLNKVGIICVEISRLLNWFQSSPPQE
jgi:hypothetical protein